MVFKFITNVYIASDHAGFDLKAYLLAHKKLIDLGTYSSDSVDYPDFAAKLVKKIKDDPGSKGILLCGSGIGMSIAANRYNFIRAALVSTKRDAKLARLHNDANVLVLSARHLKAEKALSIIECFLETKFEGGRHQRRVEKLNGGKND